MNLLDTLFSIEKYLGFELDSLLPLAEQDNVGGYHPDEAQRKWWVGAIWEVEGKILYSVIRTLRPRLVVEIGSGLGCSSNHIASALHANGGGKLVTIDRGNTPRILDELKEYVEVRSGDALEYLESLPDHTVDFILEDGDHTEAQCYAVAELAKRKLTPGGVLMSHDAAHFAVGGAVLDGYNRAGADYRVYLTEPSDCGWLVWRYGEAENSISLDEPVLQAQESQVQSKKRTRKVKAG